MGDCEDAFEDGAEREAGVNGGLVEFGIGGLWPKERWWGPGL